LNALETKSTRMTRFEETVRRHGLGELRRGRLETLQINVGKLCNQTCAHCHVNAGPGRREIMTDETMDRIVDWLAKTSIPKVDITGGAPEIIPCFRRLVTRLRALDRAVMDRCNLTIFSEAGHETLPEFLAEHEVEVVASLPCYSQDNVDRQRGDGVFEKSIHGLRRLNALGYGTNSRLVLNLVYNPLGASLPPPQTKLEAAYREELSHRFGIAFNRLYTITNMPIARFASSLRREGRHDEYMNLLVENFNPDSVAGLMCLGTLNVGWRGEVYDCDFNQMLGMPWRETGARSERRFLWDIDPSEIEGRDVQFGDHCFGCTAGAGSSCGGAIVK
jgi:radical SAM/Cys-rich protein